MVADTLVVMGRKVLGFVDPAPELQGREIDGLPVLGDEAILRRYAPKSVVLANGIGSIASSAIRRAAHERLTDAGFQFETVCDPRAIISRLAVLKAGAQVMAGVVLQRGVVIGEGAIVNTGALVDHDCVIGSHAHIAPGVALSGGVRIGDDCHVGTAATVIQGVSIGAGAIIGAGSVVLRDIPPGARVAGVPARQMEAR